MHFSTKKKKKRERIIFIILTKQKLPRLELSIKKHSNKKAL